MNGSLISQKPMNFNLFQTLQSKLTGTNFIIFCEIHSQFLLKTDKFQLKADRVFQPSDISEQIV